MSDFTGDFTQFSQFYFWCELYLHNQPCGQFYGQTSLYNILLKQVYSSKHYQHVAVLLLKSRIIFIWIRDLCKRCSRRNQC